MLEVTTSLPFDRLMDYLVMLSTPVKELAIRPLGIWPSGAV